MSKSGVKLSNVVKKKNPFQMNCQDNECKPAVEAESNGKVVQCKTDNVSYMATCKTCESEGKVKVYYGETSRNLHVRSKEHYKDCDNNTKVSWMRKHMIENHNNEMNKCDFSWKVIGKFKKPMLRQLSEAIHINNYLEQVLGRTPNWQDREIWFSLSNNTLKYKAQPQDVLVFPFLSSV